MPRAAANLDAFAAVGEPRRREVLTVLAAEGETPVTTLVARLRWPQPQVSKHLGVLREAGLVAVRRQGRQRMYSINGQGLRTIHDWAAMFERFWSHQLDRIKARAERAAAAAGPDAGCTTNQPRSDTDAQRNDG